METLSKEHVRQVVNTIWMQLVVTTAPDVIGSWGISRLSAKQIVRNINGYDFTMAALILNVDGFLFQGNVYVALDEGCDYYRIYFEKDGKLFWHWAPNHGFDGKHEEKRVDIAFDELGGVLDSLIESGGMSKQEYDAKVTEKYHMKTVIL